MMYCNKSEREKFEDEMIYKIDAERNCANYKKILSGLGYSRSVIKRFPVLLDCKMDLSVYLEDKDISVKEYRRREDYVLFSSVVVGIEVPRSAA